MGFRPVEVLKGTLVTGRGPENFRKGLVILQIGITLVLLTSTYVIQRQLSFIDHTRLSEHKDEVVTVRLGQITADKMAQGTSSMNKQIPPNSMKAISAHAIEYKMPSD